MSDLSSSVGVHPAEPEDDPFLRSLYTTTRIDLAAAGLPAEMLEALISQQHEAREAQYRSAWPGLRSFIILKDGQQVGRILVADEPETLRLVDIALLPDQRGKGIASRAIGYVQAEAAGAGKGVRLSVDPGSLAMSLYRRLGFVASGGDTVRVEMMWRPLTDTQGQRNNAS